MPSEPPLIALDARLVAGTHTGDSTYWSGLLYGLSRIQRSVRIVLFSSTPKPADSYLDSFDWIQTPARNSRWWSLVAFPLAARKHGARAIHTQYTLSPLCREIGITTIHDVSFLIGPDWFRPKDRLLLKRTVPNSARRAAKVITVSQTSRAEIESFVPDARGKTVATPLACPPWIERRAPEEARQQVRSLGIDRPFVLTVGTRWPRKNMDLAVSAMSRLPDELPHALAITGKHGWGESELGSRGIATGYVSNDMLSCLYSAAELYVAPSRHEGFGIPVLEAFRCGCPVLCSSGGALPEVAGDAARVERSWEPEEWSSAIATMLQDRSTLEALRGRGAERERAFTWEECAATTMRVYHEVASR